MGLSEMASVESSLRLLMVHVIKLAAAPEAPAAARARVAGGRARRPAGATPVLRRQAGSKRIALAPS